MPSQKKNTAAAATCLPLMREVDLPFGKDGGRELFTYSLLLIASNLTPSLFCRAKRQPPRQRGPRIKVCGSRVLFNSMGRTQGGDGFVAIAQFL